ncbi:MAG: hypothetical protein WAN48_02005 [Actinomycetes bacterium]
MRPDRLVRGAGVAAALVLAATCAPQAADAHDVGSTSSRPVDTSFHHPLRIDNRYFALHPKTTYQYDGTVVDEEGTHRHRVVFTVTDLVKKVHGTWTRVGLDRDIQDGVLGEAELALFAQDDGRNVRSMGEYPEEYEDGAFVAAPSTWITGIDSAHGGTLVPGQPTVGEQFVEGKALSIDFYDVGQIVRRNAHTCVPVGCFRRVLVVDEWSPLAPEDGHQLKYYAPGMGLVRVGASGGDSLERMVLTRVDHLGPRATATARKAALRLDQRGRRTNDVWSQSAPAVVDTGSTLRH